MMMYVQYIHVRCILTDLHASPSQAVDRHHIIHILRYMTAAAAYEHTHAHNPNGRVAWENGHDLHGHYVRPILAVSIRPKQAR